MDIKQAMQVRHSVRKYLDKEVDSNALRELRGFINHAEALYSGIKYRLEIVSLSTKVKELKIGYVGGKISINAPCCIIAISENTKGCYENIGFIQEQIVLNLTQIGLATCWLGTFDRTVINREYGVKENEIITNVIAFGYPQCSLCNSGLRSLLGTKKRKSIQEIAYYKSWEKDSTVFLENNPQIFNRLKLAALALLSDNAQPVRMILEENVIHVFSIDNNKNKYYRLDAGIFLANIFLLLKECKGDFSFEKKDGSFNAPAEAKYIVSCSVKKGLIKN